MPAADVRLLVFDVDGVLTDGTVWLDADGRESSRFSIRDGAALVWLGRAGLDAAFLSGRASEAVTRRAAQTGVKYVLQDAKVKTEALERLAAESGVPPAEMAYMGDDLLDLPVFRRVGLSAAPADAVEEVRVVADFVASCAGGHGAARELIEHVLRAQGRWEAVVARYFEP